MSDVSPNHMNQEAAVREYLMWLEDPASLRDESAIATAAAAVESATDPIDRLHAITALQKVKNVDGSHLRAAFVEHAKSWAETNGVSAEAFRELGVPPQDLRAAGLLAGSGSSTGPRRGRVSAEMIKGSIPEGRFTISALEAASGASTATVRKVVSDLVDEGVLVDLGPDQNHTGRGRAPLLFSRR